MEIGGLNSTFNAITGNEVHQEHCIRCRVMNFTIKLMWEWGKCFGIATVLNCSLVALATIPCLETPNPIYILTPVGVAVGIFLGRKIAKLS